MKNKLIGFFVGTLISLGLLCGTVAAEEGVISPVESVQAEVQTNEGNVEIIGLNGLDMKINYTDEIPAVCEAAEFSEVTKGIVFDSNVEGYVYKERTVHYTLSPVEVKSLFYKLPDVNNPCVLDVTGVYDVEVKEETNDTNWEFRDYLNGYLKTKIHIKIGNRTLRATPPAIKEWVVIDNDNLTAHIDKNKVWIYVDGLVKMFNTRSRTRSFATTNSGTVSVVPGSYGWDVDFTGFTDSIYDAICTQSDITLTANCRSQGYVFPTETNDIGNSYVEISIPKQHMWVYKNGSLVLESDVVTGNPTLGRDTPKGAYYIMSRSQNAVLVGADYRTPVAYWMPFTSSGCGLHDATWQPAFGGSRYLSYGSHGCVNLPLSVAKQVYENVAVGYPVIIY